MVERKSGKSKQVRFKIKPGACLNSPQDAMNQATVTAQTALTVELVQANAADHDFAISW